MSKAKTKTIKLKGNSFFSAYGMMLAWRNDYNIEGEPRRRAVKQLKAAYNLDDDTIALVMDDKAQWATDKDRTDVTITYTV